jgi:preprotein translocase subunit YajC
MIDLNLCLLLAEEELPPGAAFMQFVPIIVVGVLGYLLFMRPMATERKKQQETLSALKKNDRIITIGGIIGTVADPSADGDLITIKVDDGTRMKFRKSAIQGLYEPPKDADKKS